MRLVPTIGAGLVLGTLGVTAASAMPALLQQGLVAGHPVETVEWHASTRHWDHHFHAHQESLRDHQPAEAERRIRRSLRDADPHLRDPAWAHPR